MKQILYQSTRGGEKGVPASLAVLQGLAKDGGLFFPEEIPVLEKPLSELAGMSYQEVAFEVMRLFLTDYTEEELKHCINSAYDEKFETDVIAPLAKADGVYYLELYHGKTIAFKDMALSILPYLMTCAARKNNVKEEIVILTATSGDTGKAALAGFADVPGTKIIVFFPDGGVSAVQKKQMVTQKGDNTFVVGVKGNFDDCQTAVKEMSADTGLCEELAGRGFRFSSANSINIGRLVPQIAYYVYAYVKLLDNGEIREGEPINVTVPTGNFGNILAAWLAKAIGLPVSKLICASNQNCVLTDFFRSGIYDKKKRPCTGEKRSFLLTSSPSMDILVSSNLERMIFEACGRDAAQTAEYMRQLKEEGSYHITQQMKKAFADYEAGFATEKECAEEIAHVFRRTGYVMDTHTAVGSRVYREYRKETGDAAKTVIASTASPYKFAKAVLTAIDAKYASWPDTEDLADELHKVTGLPIPPAIEEIRTAPVRHKTVCEVGEMKQAVLNFLAG